MRRALRSELAAQGIADEVEVPELEGGCFGLCLRGPNMVIEPDGIWYARVTVDHLAEIVRVHLIGGQVIRRLRDAMHPIWKHRRATQPPQSG
jgi:(2Fe-2S) ferredoxin